MRKNIARVVVFMALAFAVSACLKKPITGPSDPGNPGGGNPPPGSNLPPSTPANVPVPIPPSLGTLTIVRWTPASGTTVNVGQPVGFALTHQHIGPDVDVGFIYVGPDGNRVYGDYTTFLESQSSTIVSEHLPWMMKPVNIKKLRVEYWEPKAWASSGKNPLFVWETEWEVTVR